MIATADEDRIAEDHRRPETAHATDFELPQQLSCEPALFTADPRPLQVATEDRILRYDLRLPYGLGVQCRARDRTEQCRDRYQQVAPPS